MNIHEEFHRLILRRRWVRWSSRHWTPGCYRVPWGKHLQLSARLAKAQPTYAQRHP